MIAGYFQSASTRNVSNLEMLGPAGFGPNGVMFVSILHASKQSNACYSGITCS